MAHGYVQLPDDGSGKKLDMTETTIDETTVYRQRASSVGATHIAAGPVAVDDEATEVVAERPGRRSVSLYNMGGGWIYVGEDDQVTASTGMPIPPNAERVIATEAAVWAIGDRDGLELRYLEEYDG